MARNLIAIHEVHYDDDGSILGWTANAIAVCSNEAFHHLLINFNVDEGRTGARKPIWS